MSGGRQPGGSGWIWPTVFGFVAGLTVAAIVPAHLPQWLPPTSAGGSESRAVADDAAEPAPTELPRLTSASPTVRDTTARFAPPVDAGLEAGSLLVPVAGVEREWLVGSFDDERGEGRRHEAIDIPAARGTPVVAVDDGRIARLFTSEAGGLTVYQFDAAERFVYYYAHLDGYAPGLAEGEVVRRGQELGYVGTTGNAPPGVPHLHFAIMRLTAEKRWWDGTAIDPYPLLRRAPS